MLKGAYTDHLGCENDLGHDDHSHDRDAHPSGESNHHRDYVEEMGNDDLVENDDVRLGCWMVLPHAHGQCQIATKPKGVYEPTVSVSR